MYICSKVKQRIRKWNSFEVQSTRSSTMVNNIIISQHSMKLPVSRPENHTGDVIKFISPWYIHNLCSWFGAKNQLTSDHLKKKKLTIYNLDESKHPLRAIYCDPCSWPQKSVPAEYYNGYQQRTAIFARVLVFWRVCCFVDSFSWWGSETFKSSDQRHSSVDW